MITMELGKYAHTARNKLNIWIRPYIIVTTLYLVGITAILRANFNYIDDMGRVYLGYKGWSDECSRYLSDFFSGIIHADNYLTDVSPLPQMIAVMILSIAAIALLYLFTEKHKFSLWQYIAIVPVGLSPYFLECISYKYDAPYMALSITVSVIPLLFRKRNIFIYGIISILSILAVCTTYQAACGIFPMLVIILALRDWTKDKKTKYILNFLCISAVSYFIGLIIFKFFIMKPQNTYVSTSIDLIHVFDHLKTYYALILSDFKQEWLILICIIMIAFVIASVKGSFKSKIKTLLLTISALLLMLLLAFGIYPALETPSYYPRAMYGFGVLLSFLMLGVSSEIRIYWGKIASLLLAWMFFVFCFTYGNALYVQKQYTDYRIEMVAEEINALPIYNTEQEKEIQISGSIAYAPAIYNTVSHFKMLNKLIPVTFTEKWFWGSYGFMTYYDLKNLKMNLVDDFSELELPILIETQLYTIRGDDTHILIELSN